MKAELQTVSGVKKLLTALYVVVPFVAVIVGAFRLWGIAADAISVSLWISFYFINAIGISLGFHRYFTHQGFTVRFPWLVFVLGVCGSMAGEGSLFTWIGWHLKHHQMTDKIGDPHSPHLCGKGFWNMTRGMIHAHVGWLFVVLPENELVPEKLRRDPLLVKVDRYFAMFFVLGLILPPLLGALIRHSFAWMLVDFVWGSLIRLFFVHHVTWSVNSVCHLWGRRPFQTDDKSTDNFLVAVFANGEGNHNSHHAWPRSAKHGLLGQPDLVWVIIVALKKLGWITGVQTPSWESIQKRLA